jgi:arylsulfatase A-like enzyme
VSRPDQKLEGIDLMPTLTKGANVERTLYWRVVRPDARQRAVRQGDYKFIEDGGLMFLYNVRTDPEERHDLAGRDPSRVRAMRTLVTAWEKDVDEEANRAGKK